MLVAFFIALTCTEQATNNRNLPDNYDSMKSSQHQIDETIPLYVVVKLAYCHISSCNDLVK